MEALFLLVSFTLILLFVCWLVLRTRLENLEERIHTLEAAWSPGELQTLIRRIHRLEDTAAEVRPAPEPSRAPLAPVASRAAGCVATPPVIPVAREPAEQPATAVVPPQLLTHPVEFRSVIPPQPTWSERLRGILGDEEWEALVGGSLLNKIGALVLVIGITLFLAYSFGRMEAAGRASVALAASAIILAAGIFTERRARYRVFARGVIGAGWAALYATSYAIYALPAARIVENPVIGTIGMMAVAAGMIAHSLKYRVESITAVAYFAAFAALAATPSTPFAIASLIPLAASLLYLAARLRWLQMALFGLFATYGTCIARGDSGATLAASQSLLLVCWALFETFDLIRTRNRLAGASGEWIAPVNALAFLCLSYRAWAQQNPDNLWFASSCAAALYLTSAVTRAFLRPPSSFASSDDSLARLRAGSYEGHLVLAAALAGLGITGRVPGVWQSVGLALEAEILYLAGVRLRVPFLRRMGQTSFAFSLARLTADGYTSSQSVVLGHPTWNWTPPALFHAFLFYLNRLIYRPNIVFGSIASALVAVVLVVELPPRFAGAAWLFLAALLFELGYRKRLFEFRAQAYALALGGGILTSIYCAAPLRGAWVAIATAAVASYIYSLRPRFDREGILSSEEMRGLKIGGAVGTAFFSSLLIWRTAPEAYAGVWWLGLAAVLFELGNRGLPREMRYMTGPVALAGAVGIALQDGSLRYLVGALIASAVTARVLARRPANMGKTEELVTLHAGAAAAAAGFMFYFSAELPAMALSPAFALLALLAVELSIRTSGRMPAWIGNAVTSGALLRVLASDLYNTAVWQGIPERSIAILPVIAAIFWMAWRCGPNAIANIRTSAAAIVAVLLIGFEFGSTSAGLEWMAFALALYLVGWRREVPSLRLQAYGVSVLALAVALYKDVVPPQMTTCLGVVVGLYLLQWMAKASKLADYEAYAPQVASIGATGLLGSLLYGAVSGGMLTVSWGLLGLTLLAAGFPLRVRILRLQGLLTLLICILKLFIYDLRNLETMNRILSFIALGVIMLCVSWIYTRFRERLKHIL